MNPTAAVDNLTKQFRSRWRGRPVLAVADLSFRLQPGEIVGLLGPNGSGKSTTIKLLVGLLHPTAGRVTLLGRPPQDAAVRARLGYLPETSCLYPGLTAAETLDFYARLGGLPATARRQRTAELLATVGLEDTAGRPVAEFSKGMQRRLGLAQALLNRPDLLVLDEPTAGLDPVGTRQMLDLLTRLAAAGTAILLSSHLLGDVQDACHRLLVLHRGRLAAAGAVADLLAIRDRIQLELPALPDAALARVLDTLAREAGETPVVRTPTRSLASFFMAILDGAGAAR